MQGLVARRYTLLPALAGGLLGVLLAIMSYYGLLDFAGPLARGLLGVLVSALVGVLVAPAGMVGGPPPTRGRLLEAALASVLATLSVWPTVYTALSAG